MPKTAEEPPLLVTAFEMFKDHTGDESSEDRFTVAGSNADKEEHEEKTGESFCCSNMWDHHIEKNGKVTRGPNFEDLATATPGPVITGICGTEPEMEIRKFGEWYVYCCVTTRDWINAVRPRSDVEIECVYGHSLEYIQRKHWPT